MSKSLFVFWFAIVFLSLQSSYIANHLLAFQTVELVQSESESPALAYGEVVSENGPVADAQVVLFRDKLVQELKTNAAGKFELGLDTGENVNIFVSAEGMISHVQLTALKQGGAQQDRLKITLAKQTAPLGGRIIDYQGMGVSGAKLQVSSLVCDGQTVTFPTNLAIDNLKTTTDENGAFQFSGIESSMVAAINVSGPDIATATLTADSFAKEIVLVAQPSRSIKCRVIDRLTRAPIANVMGSATPTPTMFQLVQSFNPQIVYSDENGVFELSGLPAFQPITVTAHPTGDEPFLRSTKQIAVENGFGVVDVEIQMEPGVWANCKVKEFGSDGLAAAQVYYFPTPENENFQSFAESFLEGGQRLTGIATNPQGTARVVAIPGPGAIAVVAAGFPANEGVNKLTDQQRAMFAQITQQELTAVEFVDPKDLDEQIELDFLVSKGRAIEIVVPADQVSATDHLVVHRAKSKTSMSDHVIGAKFNAEQFQPGEVRTVLIHSPRNQLGTAVEIKAEAESPVAVELRPTGSFSAQIVDADGQPQQGLVVKFSVAGNSSDTSDGFDVMQQVITDANGRVNVQSLIAAVQYRIEAVRLSQNRQMMDGAPEVDSRWVVAKDLEINESELVDFGAIQFGAKELAKPERLASKQVVAKENSLPSLVSGKIVDADGNPIVDAKISFNTWPKRTGDALEDTKLEPMVLAQSGSDSEGYFQLPLDEKLEKKIVGFGEPDSGGSGHSAIVVMSDKRGSIQISTADLTDSSGMDIQMKRDKIVRGKVTSSRGQQKLTLAFGQKMDVYGDAEIRKILGTLGDGKSLELATKEIEPVATLDPLAGGLPLATELAANDPFRFRGIPINAIFKLHVFDDSGLQKTITVVSRPHAAMEIKLSEDSTDTQEFHGSRINLSLDKATVAESPQ